MKIVVTPIGAFGRFWKILFVAGAAMVGFAWHPVAAQTASNVYWTGSGSSSWATTANWSTTNTSEIHPVTNPASSWDVIFGTGTPTPANLTTTLNAVTTINDLTFITSSNVTIGAGTSGTLTLDAGLGATYGIDVQSGAGAVTISAPVILGANQTWINGSSNTLTISGGVGDGGHGYGLTTSGAGTVLLSNTNTYTGATTVNGGTLQLGNGASGSISSSSILNIGGGGTFNYVGGNSTSQTVNGLNVTSGFDTVNVANNNDTLNLGAITISSNAMVDFGTTGTINTTTSVDDTGILGPNVYYGTGTNLNYVTLNGTSITSAYSNATPAGANLAYVATATVNYTYANLGAAPINATAAMTGNTLQFTGVSLGLLVPAELETNGLSLNGLMNSGTGLLVIGGYYNGGASDAGLVTPTGGLLDIVDDGQGIDISADVNGSGGLAYDGPGAGTLTLISSSNTYTGNTVIDSGTLKIALGSRLGDGAYAGAISIAAGSTFNYGSSAAQTLSGAISGAGAFIKSGTGPLLLTGLNTLTGAMTINSGTLTLTGSLSSSSALQFGGAGAFTYGVAGGSQTVNGLNLLGGMGTVTVSGGDTLNLGAITTSNGGTVDFGTTGTTTTTTAATNGILGPYAYSGAGAGLNYATVSGTDIVAYTGATADATGTLGNVVSATANYSYADGVALGANQTGNTLQYTGAAGTTALNGNSLSLNGLMNAGTGTLTITGNPGAAGLVTPTGGTLDIADNTQAINISANITGSGGLAFSGPSAGTLTLSGSNSYTGNTTIGSGTLAIGGAGQLGNGGAYGGNIIDAGTFNYGSSANQTVSGALSGAGVLTQSGAGTLAFTGANSFTGAVNVQNGTLQLATGATAGNGTLTLGTSSNSTSGIFVLGNGNTPGSATFSNLVVATSNTGTFNALEGGSSADSTLIIDAPDPGDQYTIGVIIGGGTTTNNPDANNLNVVWSNPTDNSEISEPTLTGASTYTGTTTIGDNVFLFVGNGVSGSIASSSITLENPSSKVVFEMANGSTYSGNVILNNSSELEEDALSGSSNTLSGVISGSGSATLLAETSTTILTGADTVPIVELGPNGTVQIGNGTTGSLSSATVVKDYGSGTTLIFDMANGSTYAGTIIIEPGYTGGNLEGVEPAGAVNTLSGSIAGYSVSGFIQAGAGTTIIASPFYSVFSGPTIVEAGTLQIGNGLSGTIWTSTNAVVDAGATLAFDEILNSSFFAPNNGFTSNTNAYPNSISDSGTVEGLENAITNTNLLPGQISGPGGFTQAGIGTTLFAGTNDTYTGATLIDAGTLLIGAGTIGSISSSSTLEFGGSGTFNYSSTSPTSQTVNGLELLGGVGTVVTISGDTINLGAITVTTNGVMADFGTAGTLTTTTPNTNGILGPYADSGTGAGLKYATVNGGNDIVAYTGATADATGTLGNVVSAAVNYSYGDGTALGANQTGNTLQYTGGANTTALGTHSLTLNGLMNSGTGLLTITGAAGAAGLVTPNSGVLDIADDGQGTAISANVTGSGGLAFAGFGSGALLLSGSNSYTGNTEIDLGTLEIGGAGQLGGGVYAGQIIDAGTLLYGSSLNQTLSGVISGGGAVTQGGTGTLTLSGSNTYTGETTVNTGTLSLTGSLNGSSVVTTGNGVFSETGAGVISGAGGVTQSGTGTSTLGGANVYTGATTVNAGTLSLTGSLTGSSVQANSNGVFSETGTGVINGGVTVTQNGTGTSTLGGANTYTGATIVNAGTLDLTGTLNPATTLEFGGVGTFEYTAAGPASQTVSGLIVNAAFGTVDVAAGDTLNVGAVTFNSDYNGMIDFGTTGTIATTNTTTAGNTGIIGPDAYTGTGTSLNYATLNGSGDITAYTGATVDATGTLGNVTNTNVNYRYSGSVTVTGAPTGNTLQFTGGAATMTLSSSVLDVGASLTVNGLMNSGTGQLTITGDGTEEGIVTPVGGGMLYITDAGHGINISTMVTGNGGLVYGGPNAGTLILSNDGNSYLGPTVVDSGALNVQDAYALGYTANVTVASGAALQLQNVQNDGSGVDYTLYLSGNGVSGNGALENVSGTNTYSGAITLVTNATIGSDTNLLIVNGGSVTGNYGLTLTGAGNGNLADGISEGQDENGASTLTKNGTGAWIISGSNTYTGVTTVNAGTLSLSGTLNGSSIVTNSNAVFSETGTGTINDYEEIGGVGLLGGGVTTFTQNSTGTSTLSGTNTYSGATTINAGTVTLGGAGLLGAGTYAGAISISAGATFNDDSTSAQVLTGAVSDAGALTVGAGMLQIGNGTTGAITGSGTITVSGATLVFDEATGGTVTAAINDNTTGVVEGAEGSGATNTLSGTISGVGVFLQTGSGTTLLTGTDTYTGATTVSAGTLQIGNGTSGSINGSAATVSGGAVLAFDLANGGSYAKTIANSGTVEGAESIGTVTNTLSGTISGAGGFTQAGPGTTLVTGTDTYTGATTITAGTLWIGSTGRLAAGSAVAVNGGTFMVNGAVGGTVSLAGGATLSSTGTGSTASIGALKVATGGGINLDNGAGTTRLNGTTLSFSSGGSTISIEVGSTSDLLNLSGAYSGSGVFTVNVDSLAGASVNSAYEFIDASGGLATGDFTAGVLSGIDTGDVLSFSGGGTEVSVTIVGVASPNVAYWNGSQGNNWTTLNSGNANWSTTLGGGTNTGAVPGSASDVIFATSSAAGTNTVLGTNTTINSLKFSSANSFGIGGSTNSLTLLATTTSNNTAPAGITVSGGAGADTVSANVILGTNQTWTNNSSNLLTVSGNIGDNGNNYALTTAGSGTTLVTGTDTYTGATTVSAGTLQIGNGTSGSINGSAATVSSGAVLAFDLANGGSYAQTIADSGTVEGAESIGTVTNTLSGTISGAGGFTQAGPGTTLVTGTDTYTGATTVSAGTLQIGNGTSGSINGSAATVSGGAVLAFDLANGGSYAQTIADSGTVEGAESIGTVTNTLSGAINGAGGFTQAGPGTTLVTGTDTYTGATTITAGTLSIGSTGKLAAGSAVAVNGGTFLVNGAVGGTVSLAGGATLSSTGTGSTASIGALTVATGGSINLDNGAGTTRLNGTTLSFSSGGSTISIEVGSTSDLLNLSGAYSGSGVFTVNVDSLAGASVNSAYEFIDASGGLATGDFTAGVLSGIDAGDVLSFSGGGTEVSVTIVAAVSSPNVAYWNGSQGNNWTTVNSGNANWSTTLGGGTNTGAAPGSVSDVVFATSSAAGTNTVLGTNTTINSLQFSSANSFGIGGSTNSLTLLATTTSNNTAPAGITVSGGAGADTISANVILGTNQTWTNNSSNLLTVSGNIGDSGNNYALTTAGSGTLLLSGTNTFGGGLDIQGGTLEAGANGATSTGALTLGAANGSNSATLIAASGVTVTNAITLGGATGSLKLGNYGANAVAAYSGAVHLNGNNLTIFSYSNGGASTTVSGGITGTGSLTLLSGGGGGDTANVILSGASVNNAGTITNSGSGTGATTISAVIGANVTGVVQDSATSELVLTATNSYTGATTIDVGELGVASAAALGAGSSITFNGANSSSNDAVLDYTGGGGTLTQNLTVSTGDYGVVENSGGGVLDLNGNISKNGSVLTLAAGRFVVNGVISGATNNSDLVLGTNTYGGAATVGLTAANTYNGPTDITDGSTLLTGTNNALPASPASNLTLGGAGDTNVTNTLDLLGTSETVASLNVGSTSTNVINQVISSNGSAGGTPAIGSSNSLVTGTLTVNYTTTNTADTFSGSLGGGATANNFSLVKSGAGTLVLGGANTYTGATTVNGGVLDVIGSTHSSGVTVAGGATLAGTSSVGAIVVNSGGVVSPGSSPNIQPTFGESTNNVLFGSSLTLGTNTILSYNLYSSAANTGLAGATNPLQAAGGTEIDLGLGAFTVDGAVTLQFNDTGINGVVGDPNVYNLVEFGTGNIASELSDFTITGIFSPGNGSASLAVVSIGNEEYLQLDIVPEPSAWVMVVLGLGLLVFWSRRKRRVRG